VLLGHQVPPVGLDDLYLIKICSIKLNLKLTYRSAWKGTKEGSTLSALWLDVTELLAHRSDGCLNEIIARTRQVDCNGAEQLGWDLTRWTAVDHWRIGRRSWRMSSQRAPLEGVDFVLFFPPYALRVGEESWWGRPDFRLKVGKNWTKTKQNKKIEVEKKKTPLERARFASSSAHFPVPRNWWLCKSFNYFQCALVFFGSSTLTNLTTDSVAVIVQINKSGPNVASR
jgi:hypothetical protein